MSDAGLSTNAARDVKFGSEPASGLNDGDVVAFLDPDSGKPYAVRREEDRTEGRGEAVFLFGVDLDAAEASVDDGGGASADGTSRRRIWRLARERGLRLRVGLLGVGVFGGFCRRRRRSLRRRAASASARWASSSPGRRVRGSAYRCRNGRVSPSACDTDGSKTRAARDPRAPRAARRKPRSNETPRTRLRIPRARRDLEGRSRPRSRRWRGSPKTQTFASSRARSKASRSARPTVVSPNVRARNRAQRAHSSSHRTARTSSRPWPRARWSFGRGRNLNRPPSRRRRAALRRASSTRVNRWTARTRTSRANHRWETDRPDECNSESDPRSLVTAPRPRARNDRAPRRRTR